MLRTPKPFGHGRRPVAIGSAALALVLAACGSVNQDALQTGDPALISTTETTDPAAEASALSLPEASEGAVGSLVEPAVSETPEPTAPTTTPTIATTPTTAAQTTTTAAPTTAAPAATSFPAVAVQRISDGTQVDAAAQLSGGSLPVLLWFWSPF